MKTWKIITIAVLAVTAVTLLVGTVSAQMMGGWGGYGPFGGYGGMMGGYGGGMMGGNGYGYNPYNPAYPAQPGTNASAPQYYQPVYPFQFGGGCHGRGAYGYGATAPYTYNGIPLNITTATTIANNYVASTGNLDLTVKEIEEYQANFYVGVTEKSTGNGAFELLIDKYTGSIYPEMGPNLMWNTKYGMMRGGILGGIFGTPTATMPVSADQAKTDAQQWLSINIPGATVGEVTPFYGYYHVMVENAGTTYGMLSVNGYSGQVWYHTWHGAFINEIAVS